jgi:hypothetical protein
MCAGSFPSPWTSLPWLWAWSWCRGSFGRGRERFAPRETWCWPRPKDQREEISAIYFEIWLFLLAEEFLSNKFPVLWKRYSTSYGDLCLKMRDNLCFCYCIFLTYLKINCSAWKRVSNAELQKIATFSTLIIGLARTGDQTRATCGAGSGASRSAIHYDYRIINIIVCIYASSLVTSPLHKQ